MTIRHFILILTVVFLAGCAGISPTWSELWGEPDARTDLIDVRLTVQLMPFDQLQEICGEMVGLRACGNPDRVYIQGDPAVHTVKLKIQFLSWTDIADKCGWNTAACYDSGTLYTYPYDVTDTYKMGAIGDLIAEAMNLDLPFNRRAHLGHELMAHVAGQGHPGNGFRR